MVFPSPTAAEPAAVKAKALIMPIGRHGMWPVGRELQELLAPHRVRDFLDDHWARKPLYIAGTPDKFRHLNFDLGALERAIRDLEPRDRLRVRFVGADDKVKRRPANLDRYSIRDGQLTVCADWINDRFESLASFCAGIKTGLSLPGAVFMTCYASPHGHGFSTHWDAQASFILQIEGSKRWRFSPTPAVAWPPTVLPNAAIAQEVMHRYPWMQVQFPNAMDEGGFLEQVLNPGDVLFLPAGTWHRARAIDYSVALTMACVPMTAADFMDDILRGYLSSSANWRRNVPPVPMESTRPDRLPAVVQRFFEARLSELRDHVRSLRAADLFETWTHHVASLDTPYEMVDGTPLAHAVELSDRLAVDRVFPVRYVTRPRDGSISIYYLDVRLDLRHDALPMIKRMLQHSTFTARSAIKWLGKDFGWNDVKPILQELVQAGILRVIAPSAFPER